MSIEMLTLKVISPLALHQRRSSEQFAPTLDYIAGSAIRGALADLYLSGKAERANEELFKRLFLSEEVRYSDCFPSKGQGNDLTHLWPATAATCKRFFEDHFAESLTDQLLLLELLREWSEPNLSGLDFWYHCPHCHGKRSRVESLGYYTSVEQPERLKVTRRMMANTAVRRKTRTAAPAMLFSHEVIEESSAHERGEAKFFRGAVRLPDDLSLRANLLELAPHHQELAVGYGRSRGLGQLRVETWGTPRSEAASVRERFAALNETASQLWQKVGRVPQGQYFSLTLQSHLALQDEEGQPVLGDIQPTHLGLPADVERCRVVLSAEVVPGWNAAQEMPKSDCWVLERGSVLLFRLPLGVDPEPTLKRLEAIAANGVGARRSEGFGQVAVCDPFHYHFVSQTLKGGVA